MNQLLKTKLYLFIVIFFMQSFIYSHANSNINDDISQQNNDLSGLNIAITAGPTHEIIDSAKYIHVADGNASFQQVIISF
jgi:hypothetical protein